MPNTALSRPVDSVEEADKLLAQKKHSTHDGETSLLLPSAAGEQEQKQHDENGVGDGACSVNSLAVIYFVLLLNEACRGLVLPSMWPYLHSLGGTKNQLGVLVAGLSVGRIATTIPLGFLSDHTSVSLVLVYTLVVQIIGHLIYARAATVPILFLSRVIIGVGSATVPVCRAYVARTVPFERRTYVYAYLSAAQFIGFSILPGVGGLLALLPHKKGWFGTQLNGFTYPAYVLCLCNILAIPIILALLVEPPQVRHASPEVVNSTSPVGTSASAGSHTHYGSIPKDDARDNATSISSDRPLLRQEPSPDSPTTLARQGSERYANDASQTSHTYNQQTRHGRALVIGCCMFLNTVLRGMSGELEAVTVPFLMTIYGLGYGVASYCVTAIGIVGFVMYFCMKPIAKRFSDRLLVQIGLVTACFAAIPLSIRFGSESLPSLPYIVCIGILWSVAFPVAHTALLSLFSKILAELPAGGYFGVFAVVGNFGRISFAVLATRMWSELGCEAVYAATLLIFLISVGLVGSLYKQLVPSSDVRSGVS